MINFQHKPCCPDNKKSTIVARRLRKKAKKSKNDLEYLLNKRLDTKLMIPIHLNSLTDFPKLKRKEIVERITYGTFQVKQSLSYVGTMLTNTTGFIMKQKKSKSTVQVSDSKSKIIAVEITSRHKRSELKEAGQKKDDLEPKIKKEFTKLKEKYRNFYKVFIQYISDVNSPKGIKGIKHLILSSSSSPYFIVFDLIFQIRSYY